MNTLSCEHGNLKRQCELCDIKEDLTAAQADLAEWRTACEQKTELMRSTDEERKDLQRQVISLQADNARLRDQLRIQTIWVTASLKCREHVWDSDQREAATECCLFAGEILSTPLNTSALDELKAGYEARNAELVEWLLKATEALAFEFGEDDSLVVSCKRALSRADELSPPI